MSKKWTDITKKNSNKVIEKKEKVAEKEIKIEKNYEDEYEIEFKIKYDEKINKIKNKFLNHINKNGLPFFENEELHSTIYDFIKYNSYNYNKIVDEITNELTKIENEEDEYFDDNDYFY